MVMDWFNYSIDFPGMSWLGPVLGSAVFWWGGWPFLTGGLAEIRDRQPGMMLLISMAITVAYAASMATSLDWLDLEFWWELALLVTIMLLGHWQEMKAIGQARGALAALAELLPDDAELIDGAEFGASNSMNCPSATSSWSAQVAESRPTGWSSPAPPSSTSR